MVTQTWRVWSFLFSCNSTEAGTVDTTPSFTKSFTHTLRLPTAQEGLAPSSQGSQQTAQSHPAKRHTLLNIWIAISNWKNSFFEKWHSAFHLLMWACANLEQYKSLLSCMVSTRTGSASYLQPWYLTLMQRVQIILFILDFLVSELGHSSIPFMITFACISEIIAISIVFFHWILLAQLVNVLRALQVALYLLLRLIVDF